MAVGTTDGAVKYDVAMAMVWVEDGQEAAVDNANEAYAFASCRDCVTVAIAFQVVVIVGQADVVVPENVSAAVNYDCFECITAAVAKQLVVTVDALPGEDQVVALADIWADLAEFAATIPTLPLDELLTRLEDYEEQIKQVLTGAVAEAPSAGTTTDATATPGAEPTTSPTGEATDDPSASPTGTASEPTPSGSATPTEPAPSTTAAEPTPTAEASSPGGEASP
jgi:putative peptide zinc metalloprotease protein